MKNFDPISRWNADAAKRYAKHLRGDEDDAVAFLASHAGDGEALEFAIGTGHRATFDNNSVAHVSVYGFK